MNWPYLGGSTGARYRNCRSAARIENHYLEESQIDPGKLASSLPRDLRQILLRNLLQTLSQSLPQTLLTKLAADLAEKIPCNELGHGHGDQRADVFLPAVIARIMCHV